MEVLTLELALAAAIAAGAALAKGFAGFGGGMIMVPLLALVYGPVEAVALVTILEGLATYQLLPQALPKTEWREIAPLAALTALFTPVGVWALISVDPALMQRLIGGLVVAFALIALSGWRYNGPTRPALTLGVGSFAGLLMGWTGLGGPPVLLYMLARAGAADRARAGIISYFAITITVLLATLLWQGTIGTPTLWRSAALTPLFLAGTWLGSRFYGRANDQMFRRVALSLLVVAGATALVG